MAITKILNIQEAKSGNPSAHLNNAVEYIMNPDKTENCVLVGGMNCIPESAFEQMMETKELYQKTGKRQGYHVIISFSPEEKVSPEQAFDVAEGFAKDLLGDDFEAVYAVHTDKNHMHAHIIWNSVSITDGHKYNSPKGNWKNVLQPITNKYCEQLGLGICPAQYSGHSKNMSRAEWQEEQELKEFMLRDARFCADSAGSITHFEFLMKRLGYEFEKDRYMSVRIPGRRNYYRLDKLDERFEEDRLESFLNRMSVQPYFYSSKPSLLYHRGLSSYQESFYMALYRIRVIEQKRFTYSSARYAKDIQMMHKLHDEYLFIVDNNIRSVDDLMRHMEKAKDNIERIDERQHEIYKNVQKRKRAIKDTEDIREYQKWKMEADKRLYELKTLKRTEKSNYKMAEDILKEKISQTQMGMDISEDEILEDDKVIMPLFKAENDKESNKESDRQVVEELTVQEEKIIMPADYQAYKKCTVEERMKLLGITEDAHGMEVVNMVKAGFNKAGYEVGYDEMIEESEEIARHIQGCRVNRITGKLNRLIEQFGSYERIPVDIKAAVFEMSVSAANENLKIYVQVLNKLGIKMEQDEMFEEYQRMVEGEMETLRNYKKHR